MTIERAALATASSSSESLPSNTSTHRQPLLGTLSDEDCGGDFSEGWLSSRGSQSSLSPTVNPHEDEVELVPTLWRRKDLTACSSRQNRSAAHSDKSWTQVRRNSVGVQGPELRSKSTGACARTSNGRGIMSRRSFVPFEPRPGKKPGRRGLLEVSGGAGR